MRKVLIVILVLFVTGLSAQQGFRYYTINGNFSSKKSGKIYFTIFEENNTKKDSAYLLKGKFQFKGMVSEPVYGVISWKPMDGSYNRNTYSFYVEPADMQLTGAGDSLKQLVLKGSKLNDDSKKLKDMMKDVDDWSKKIGQLYEEAEKNKNQAVMDSLDELDNELTKATRKVVAEFVQKNPSSLRSAMAIEQNFGYYAEAEEVEPLYNLLDENIKQSATGQKVKTMLDVYKTTAVGQPAPDITQTDTTGKVISLGSLKGKYVLVDFWASWCGPCRKENPNVVKAYNRYKDKGFEIFGVSYDTKKDRWENAIIKDGLTWLHVSDLKGWKNASSETYYIKAIPSNVLIDKEGRIIGKNLLGKKLYAKLDEIFGVK